MLILLNLSETAELVGHHPMHVRLLVKNGQFPKPLTVPGKRVRTYFIHLQVNDWITARAVKDALDKQQGKKKRGRPAKSRKEPAGRRRGWPSIATRNLIETEGAGS